MKYLVILFFNIFLFLTSVARGQDCSIKIYGRIFEQGSSIPLQYTNIFIEESQSGTVSDSLGNFVINNVCPGSYHLKVSHISCTTQSRFLILNRDTLINFYMDHHAELLNEVIVHDEEKLRTTETSNTLGREQISMSSQENLGDVIESVAGVGIIHNGAGISKPVIQGMYGNRISLINNGITLSSQQWGNDHAPEVDPFFAGHIAVIKGASALAYSGNSLGGIILVSPSPVEPDPHLHGEANYVFQTNGRGHTINTSFQKYAGWSWRISTTMKLSGDTRSPDYYLTNTGKKEANAAFQLEKSISDKIDFQGYYSFFNARVGVLRGAHIGNLTDLEDAIGRDMPFFTKDNFSYSIHAPYQNVSHHMLKLEFKYKANDNNQWLFRYGGQINDRNEFDIRRGGRTDIPALGLNKVTNFFETQYASKINRYWQLKSGIQNSWIKNTNNPDTGIIPLIPNYAELDLGAFVILTKDLNNLLLETGARYDYKQLEVSTISKTLPRDIQYFNHQFHNYSFSGGLKYLWGEQNSININSGFVARSPAINELHSFGLHQGAGGIEEGNTGLNLEQSFKTILSGDLHFGHIVFTQIQTYYQRVHDYIFLKPGNDFRLTIRGAFPVFLYEQTNASLSGLDFKVVIEPNDFMKVVTQYSLIHAIDLINKEPLIFIPANNLTGSLTFNFSEKRKLKNAHVTMNGKYVFEKSADLAEQDYLAPPEGYILLGMQASGYLPIRHNSLRLNFQIENLLNQQYRDYLNRLRYFADEQGITFTVGVNYKF